MLLTIPQVADRLGISRQRAHKLASEGRIKAQKVGRLFLVSEVELKRLRRTKRRNGRPKG